MHALLHRDARQCREFELALKRHLLPLFPADGVWLQDRGLYHSTIFHASTHMVSRA